MKQTIFGTLFTMLAAASSSAQALPLPSGNPADFKVKTCLHSVSYAGFWRGQAKLSVDEFLLKAKELGYDGVMLMAKKPHLSPLDYDKEARAKLKKRIQDLGLTLVGLAGYTDFTAGIDKQGVPNVEIQAAYVGQLAELANDVGTKTVRIFTGYERPGIPFDQQYATVLDGIRLSAKEAAKYGVTLVVQNHHDIANHQDVMYWLLKELNQPNVQACWDAWSPNVQGYSPEVIAQSVVKMKPYLAMTIAADYAVWQRPLYNPDLINYEAGKPIMRAVPMGEGVIDYKTFIGSLKKIGYQGYIVYEMCAVLDGGGSIDNLDSAARKFITYVNQFK